MVLNIDDPVLFQVAKCPIDFGPVFALKRESGELFFFAPCCGVAWASPPSATLDEVLTLSDFVTSHVQLPTREEVVGAGFDEDAVAECSLRHWADDIPLE